MSNFLRLILVHDWIASKLSENDDDRLETDGLFLHCFWDKSDWQVALENARCARMLLKAVEEEIISQDNREMEFFGSSSKGRESRLKNLNCRVYQLVHDTRVAMVNLYAALAIRVCDEKKLTFVADYIAMKGIQTDVEPMLALVREKQDYVQTRRLLMETLKFRNISETPSIVEYIKSKTYLQQQLKIELQNLQNAYAIWCAEDKLKNSRVKIDTKALAELRSYSNPPKEVFLLVKASLVLLGFDSKSIVNWGDILTIFSSCKANKTDIVKCFNSVNCNSVDLETVFEAELYLNRCTWEKVNRVSSGAALFYRWTMHKITVVKRTWGVQSSH